MKIRQTIRIFFPLFITTVITSSFINNDFRNIPSLQSSRYTPDTDIKVSVDEFINASDYGVKSNSFENASIGIKKAIAACKLKNNPTLVLPGGRIDLWPDGADQKELFISNATEDDTLSKVKTIGFLIEGFKNLTIEGNNTLIILHGKMVSFALLNSLNITIKDLRFDYERPTMSELTIKSVTPLLVETTIHPDSKYFIDKGDIYFYGNKWKTKSYHTILYQTDKKILKYSSFEPFQKSLAIETAPLQVKFQGDFSNIKFQPGDILTIRDPYRDNAGAFINESKNIKLENIKMHYMHGLGIVAQFSENISLIKVDVAPREGSERIISSFADCFHFSGCKGSILIDSCLTSGSHDDPINVHGTHLKVTAIKVGRKITVKFMHHQTYGFKAFFAEDRIAFIDPKTLMPTGYANIKNAVLLNNREMELELMEEIPSTLKAGICIENLTWTPEVTIRNSRFEKTNTRGILITTRRKVLIENNTFFRTGMHAILIANDAANWYESGAVKDVLIRNNRFEECAYNSSPDNFIISIAPENHQLIKEKYVHQNIRIENNFFKVYEAPLLSARSVNGLVFSNNTIEKSALIPGENNKPSIKLIACNNVMAKDNIFKVPWKITMTVQSMSTKQINSNKIIVQKN